MHGIRKAAHIIDHFEGVELIQICIGFADVIFNFAPKGRISVYAEQFFKENEKFLLNLFSGDQEISPFGKMVLGSNIDNDVLKITLTNGSSILIRDDSDHYESVRFEIDGEVEVI
jgi:hypothetical protein